MKKLLACLVCIVMMFAFASCVNNQGGNNGGNNGGNSGENNNSGDVTVMTYDEYAAAELEAKVVIEAYVQATQSWWFDSKVNHGKISVYAQDEDGAYFIYEMPCTEEEAAELVPGTKIRVSGYKAEWSGEFEIIEAEFEIIEADPWIADATDVTALLGSDELIDYQNQFVSFSGLFVKSVVYQNGAPGKDIYVTVTYKGADYDFCVESYLTAPDSDLYAAVGALNAGDVIDVEGFLYWYNGVNTHITGVSVSSVMSYADYNAAALDDRVVVDAYVQAHQSWWDNKITVYAADNNGAYFIYEMACSEEDATKLTTGAKIRVVGYKAAWSGEIEIVDCHFITLDADAWVAEATDVTALIGSADLEKDMNKLVAFKNMTVVAYNEDGAAFEYQGGIAGKDIYVKFSNGTETIECCVESYLTDSSSELYKAVEALQVGDTVDVEGFLYWYNGANPHITKVTVK